MTLVELLVVITILVLVTSVTVPMMAPALENRHTREAARMVSTFISSARNRALDRGRPAGVWLERMPGLAEACATLSFAEVPLPYTGDFMDSQVEVFVWPDWPSTVNREHWNIVVPKTRHYYGIDTWSSPDPDTQTLVQPGDYIKFAFGGKPHRLQRVHDDDFVNHKTAPTASYPLSQFLPNTGPWYWHIGYGANRTAPTDAGYTNSRHIHDNTFVIHFFYENHRTQRPYIIPGGNLKTTASNPDLFMPHMVQGVPYQIIRRPIKMSAGSIQLPEQSCIDLNYSCVGGFQRSAESANATTGVVFADPGVPFHPRFDEKDTYMCHYRGESLFPEDSTPIIIMFSPDGSVERIYRWTPDPLGLTWEWTDSRPVNPIYLLIGKREKVPAEPDWGPESGDAQYNNNWLDLGNLWITINPRTGLVATSRASDFVDVNQVFVRDPINVFRTRYDATRANVLGGL